MGQRIGVTSGQTPVSARHQRPPVTQSEAEQDEAIRAMAEAEEAGAPDTAFPFADPSSDSTDEDYEPPRFVPRSHDHEAGGSSLAPPPSQMDPALVTILQRMQEDSARQARDKAAATAAVQDRQDELQRQFFEFQHQQ